MEKSKPKPSVTRYGQSHLGAGHQVEISNLSPEDAEKVRGVMSGRWWMKRELNGDLAFRPVWEAPPDPVSDPDMVPFWRKNGDNRGWPEVNLVDDTYWPPYDGHFTIQHLCGYNYSPENYRAQAKELESFGFVCLRSRRDDSGRYWEIWYLPGLWAAKGRLQAVLPKEEHDDESRKKRIEVAVSFLCRNASFGTLDVAAQRAAMVAE